MRSVLFLAALAAVLATCQSRNLLQVPAPAPGPAPTPAPAPSLPSLEAPSAPAGPTLAQVATHASESDCWVAINGKVRCSPCAVRPAGARHVLAPCCRCMRCAQRELQAVAPHPPTSAHTLSAPAPRVTLQVYDLTAWLPQHPGGVAILAVHCGTDATAPFTMQHGQSGEPQETLPSYFVADLSA